MSRTEHSHTAQQIYPAGQEANAAIRPSQPLRVFSSRELFAGTAEIAIEHAGALYRLKITRQGKLILNK